MIEAEQQMAENEKEREELAQAYKRLFMTDDGKTVYEDLGKFCNGDKTCVCERAPNSLQTHYESGKRRVYLRINSMISRKERDV